MAARSRLGGRVGLLFAALAGAGAASLVGSLLRSLPGAAAIAADNPVIFIVAPLPIGALVAVLHIFWLRRLLAAAAAASPPADKPPAPLRTLVPPADADGGSPPRWRPVIRN